MDFKVLTGVECGNKRKVLALAGVASWVVMLCTGPNSSGSKLYIVFFPNDFRLITSSPSRGVCLSDVESLTLAMLTD